MGFFGRHWKITAIFALTTLLILGGFGINNNGYRTVVQYPWGTTFVKFTPGWYITFFGSTTEYKDAGTFSFCNSRGEDECMASRAKASVDSNAIAVRYNDGGLGDVEGIVRWELPKDEKSMLDVHRTFRSQTGLANNLIAQQVQEAMNLTAGLMSSEEAYAEKREEFRSHAKVQSADYSYATEQKTICEDNASGNRECREVAAIKKDTESGKIVESAPSPIKEYAIRLTQFTVKKWDFEPKTLEQISKKREATMAIITAKADAEAAKQLAITAEEKGKAEVVAAQYEKEVVKIKEVVEAQKKAEVAVIDAKKKVDLAEQLKLEKEWDKQAAAEEKQAAILRGEGEAEARRLVMEADNALALKLETEERIQKGWADAYAQRKVPSTVFATGGDGTGGAVVGADSEVSDFMKLLTIDAAKRLNYDRSVEKAQ